MKIVKLLPLLFISILGHSQSENLLKNGGFEDNTVYWKTYNSTVAVSSFKPIKYDVYSGTQSLEVNVSKLGDNPWDINLVQPFKSRRGITYEISFYAKSNRPGNTIKVQLQNSTYNSKDFFLTNDWEQYSWVTTAEESNLELSIHFLKQGSYLLDKLIIKKDKRDKYFSNSDKYTDTNLIENGDFQNGFENWINITDGSSKATYKVNSKKSGRICMKVNVLKLGENPWDVQSITEVPLRKNKTYYLSFNARGLGNKKIKLLFLDEKRQIYIAKEFDLEFEWKQYDWQFTAESNDMKLAIHYLDKGIFELDDFELKLLDL